MSEETREKYVGYCWSVIEYLSNVLLPFLEMEQVEYIQDGVKEYISEYKIMRFKSLMEEKSRRTVVLSSLTRTLATPNLGCVSEIKMKKCFFILYFARFALTLPQKIEKGHLCALTSSRFFLN